MAEALEAKPSPKFNLLRRVGQNPVILKELRARMRGGRAFILITIYVGLLSTLISSVYFIFLASYSGPGYGVDARQQIGKIIFGIVVSMELVMVSFIAPALTAGAISSEREHQTYDLLRTTLLPARSLVLGKLSSALSFILILLIAAFPMQSLAGFFGGVAIEETLIAFLILVVTALAYSAIGMFFSSLVKRTLVSTVLAYATAILVVFAIPMLAFFIILLFGSFPFSSGGPGLALEIVLLCGAWLLLSTNPLGTAIVSEMILIEEQSLFFFNIPLTNGVQFPFVSPWISYVIFYTLLSLFLIWMSIRLVRRTET